MKGITAVPGKTHRQTQGKVPRGAGVGVETQTEQRSVLTSWCGVCVPVRLGGVCSLGLLSLAKRYSLPEQAPVPRSSSQAVLVSTLLGLHTVLITIYIVYQRHCAYCPTYT